MIEFKQHRCAVSELHPYDKILCAHAALVDLDVPFLSCIHVTIA